MEAYRAGLMKLYFGARDRLSREDGQGGVEYLGVVIAAALLVLVIVGAASGFGEQITSAIGEKIDSIISGGGD